MKTHVDYDKRVVVGTDDDGNQWVRKRDFDKLCRFTDEQLEAKDRKQK